MDINTVLLAGTLGKDPEMIRHHLGKLARLSLLTEESHLNPQGRLIKTSQIHVLTAWGLDAELAEKHLKKGTSIYVEGKLIHNCYHDRRGIRREVSEVKITGLKILT